LNKNKGGTHINYFGRLAVVNTIGHEGTQ